MMPRNGGSGRRLWRILVAIVLFALVAIGVVALFPPARQQVPQPSTLDEDDNRKSYAPVPSPSPVTDEDEFEQQQSGTGASLPNLGDGNASATGTPAAAEGANDDERQ